MVASSTASPFQGKDILITGGAGFAGYGLLTLLERQGLLGSLSRVTVYSRDEMKHYKIRQRFRNVRTVIGDVRDLDRLTAVMAGHEIVVHMAALKHVPESERDVTQAISVNVQGSQNVATAAMRAGVQSVVGISTDKVCDPVNTYGMTKALQERIFQEAQRLAPHMRFLNVRYGNVVSSTGSVIPLFIDQLTRTRRVTITSMQMTRFWISIHDAVTLIEDALASSGHGYTFVPLCSAATLPVLAQAVARYAGEGGNFDMQLIGLRPGEKLAETLISATEAPYAEPWTGPSGKSYAVIPPVLSQVGDQIKHFMPYTSDNASHNLTADEMVNLICEADQLCR